MQKQVSKQRISQRFRSLLWPTQQFLFRCLVVLWHVTRRVWGTVIVSMIIGGFVGNAIYALVTKGKFDPIDFSPLLQFIQLHLFISLAFLFILAGLILLSFLAQLSSVHTASLSELSEYTFQHVHQLEPSNFKLFPYIPHAYIFRDADQTVRCLLHELAHSSSSDALLGVCVFGKPAQGKTRLVWEAMRVELSDWLLVRWPRERSHPFDFSAQKGQRLVLWLDDLHEHITPEGVNSLNDLPWRFHEAGVRLIILATCQDGDEGLQTQKYLDRFLERLQSITLPDIEETQVSDLTKLLIEAGREVHKDEFDGTPGSLILGLRRMQARYQRLSLPSQQLLKAMKLLCSAGVYTYSVKRVCAVAHDLFNFDERQWRSAWEALDRGQFVRLKSVKRVRLLEPVVDIYLERAITDYPSPHATLADDWLDLKQCFEQHRDVDGLNRLGMAFAQLRLGHRSSNSQCAEECLHLAMQLRTREQNPTEWAMTQLILGWVLLDRAEHREGEERRKLLGRATQACQAALQVYTRKQNPAVWAMTHMTLGIVLRDQAELAEGEERRKLLDRAVQAYQAALQEHTRELVPARWAVTQITLGIVLRDQSELAHGEERRKLLDRAVQPYQAALQVCTREQDPVVWAMIQITLGIVLRDQAELADGEEQRDLLDRAAQAYQAALQVCTCEQDPANWAAVQNNLGMVLRDQAEVVDEAKRQELLDRAVRAYQAALQVYTRERDPMNWATTQNNLGIAFRNQAGIAGGEERGDLLDRAAQAYQAALQVRTRDQVPEGWAMTQNNLAIALFDQTTLVEGEERRKLLDQVIQAYQAALQVYTMGHIPARWAMVQNNLGVALRNQAEVAEGEEGRQLLDRAVQAYQAALQVYTQEQDPAGWAMTQNNLERVLLDQAELSKEKN